MEEDQATDKDTNISEEDLDSDSSENSDDEYPDVKYFKEELDEIGVDSSESDSSDTTDATGESENDATMSDEAKGGSG